MSVAGSMVSLVQSRHRKREAAGLPGHMRGGGKATEFLWCLGFGGVVPFLQSSMGNCARLGMDCWAVSSPSSGEKLGFRKPEFCLAKLPFYPSWVIFRNGNQFFSALDLSPRKAGSSPTQHKCLFWGKARPWFRFVWVKPEKEGVGKEGSGAKQGQS